MDVLTAITEIFEGVGDWIIVQLQTLVSLFWTTSTSGSGSLTFFGVLAVIGLGISVIFLMLRFIQNFLHFRG